MMEVYTDGSAYWKDGSAGWGAVYVLDNGSVHIEWNALPPGTTVQQAELLAVINALSNPDHLTMNIIVISDSRYVVNGMNEWAEMWLTKELRRHGVTIFSNDTVSELYTMLYNIVKSDDLGLTNSSEQIIANQKEWGKLWRLLIDLGEVRFEWVPGHSNNFWNDKADELATRGRELSYEKYGLVKLEPVRKDRRIR